MGNRIAIQDLTSNYLKSVIGISNACFGNGYLSISQLKQQLKSNWKGFVILLNHVPMGFCIVDVSQNNADEAYFEMVAIADKPVAGIKTIAILPEFQRKGHGAYLFNNAIKYLSSNSYKSILYPMWVENNSSHFNYKVEKMNFKAVKLYKTYWMQASVDEYFFCIRCGTPPCTCSLMLYKLTLKP